MSYFDPAAARRRYSIEDSENLIRIAFLNPDGYIQEAIDLAREELARRGIHGAEHQLVQNEAAVLAREEGVKQQINLEPLNLGYKIVCFFFCGIPAIVIAIIHSAAGKKRAAAEAWKWIAFGWLFRIVAVAAFLIVPKILNTFSGA